MSRGKGPGTGAGIDPTGESLAKASAGAATAAATLTDVQMGTRPNAGGGVVSISSENLIGTTFAHFRIDKPLGSGGMGDVYLATDIALDRQVALKLLKPESTLDPTFRRRFVREARAQARINHPNVCHIYFIGEQDERIFFAMEYVEGENLQQRLQRVGRIKPEEAIELARQAALGLREANRHGFTHRDVKPSNLLVDERGVVKVVDFGIVKGEDRADVAGTQEPTIVGTPLYMAPEQARGDAVDHRADIYALGATLHHLVSGAPPFEGDTPLAIISKHFADRRPRLTDAARARKSRTARLDALVDRMMAKSPADRFASYDSLVDGLEDLSPERTRPAGFWVRSFALALDLMLIMIAFLPFSAAFSIQQGNGSLVGMFTLYYLIGHSRWGRTLGKVALEIEVVDVDSGKPPRLGRTGIRFLVECGPTCLGIGAIEMIDLLGVARSGWAQVLAGVLIGLVTAGVPLFLGIAGSLSVAKRTLWDKAAHTRVRYRVR